MKKIVLVDNKLDNNSFKIQECEDMIMDDDTLLVKPIIFGLNAGMKSRICKVRDGAGLISLGDTPTSDAVVEVVDQGRNIKGNFVGKKAIIQWCPWVDLLSVSIEELIFIPKDNPLLFVTILGHTGFTAWTSMKMSKLTKDDHIIVSGAGGGVGTSLIQWASIKGAKVSGLVSEERLNELEKYNIYVINRDKEDTLPPHSVYHDGVGGVWLERSIDSINQGGRIVICGNLSGQFPSNFNRIIHKDITMLGYSVINHQDERKDFWNEAIPLVNNNKVVPICNQYYGFENIGVAFVNMFRIPHIGRQVVWVNKV